jgi:hypothetical protein
MRELTADEQALAYRFAHVQLPLDAVACDPWTEHGDGGWRRYFLTRDWQIGDVWVEVAGEQNHHGAISRWMHLVTEGDCSTSDWPLLIAALVEAQQLFEALQDKSLR